MAHEVSGSSPYPALFAAVDEIKYPYLVMVKDPGGLYTVENVTEDETSVTLLATTCLFVQWAIDQMREQYGVAAGDDLMDCLRRGMKQWEGANLKESEAPSANRPGKEKSP